MAAVELPDRWALAQLSLFFNDEDVSGQKVPFTGSIQAQLRSELPPKTAIENVTRQDLAVLQKGTPGFQLLDKGPVELGDKEAYRLEWLAYDSDIGTLHHMVTYFQVGARLYTITATHRHERFDAIRDDVESVSTTLVSKVT